MDYAVIQTGGKQYKVKKGSVINLDDLGKKPEEKIDFDKVLLYVNEDKVNIGLPYLSGVKVVAKVAENLKSEKILVAKFRAKSRYRRLAGFRKNFSKVVIEDIKIGNSISEGKSDGKE